MPGVDPRITEPQVSHFRVSGPHIWPKPDQLVVRRPFGLPGPCCTLTGTYAGSRPPNHRTTGDPFPRIGPQYLRPKPDQLGRPKALRFTGTLLHPCRDYAGSRPTNHRTTSEPCFCMSHEHISTGVSWESSGALLGHCRRGLPGLCPKRGLPGGMPWGGMPGLCRTLTGTMTDPMPGLCRVAICMLSEKALFTKCAIRWSKHRARQGGGG